jgi:hypothetical protein
MKSPIKNSLFKTAINQDKAVPANHKKIKSKDEK